MKNSRPLSPERALKEQHKRDRKEVLQLWQQNLASLSSYADEDVVVLHEVGSRSGHSKSSVRVGDARAHAHHQIQRVELDAELLLNYSMELQHPSWYVPKNVKPWHYPRMRFQLPKR